MERFFLCMADALLLSGHWKSSLSYDRFYRRPDGVDVVANHLRQLLSILKELCCG